MAFIPVPDVVQARLIWQESDGTVAQNILYCATAGVPTEDDMNEVGDAIVTSLNASLFSTITSNWTLTEIAIRAMNEAEGIEISYLDGLPANATDGATQTPNQVSYTVTLNTGLVGRSARGRLYGVGVPLPAVEANKRLSSAGQAAIQSGWENMRAGLESAGHALQVVSFQEGGVFRTEGRALSVLSVNVRFPLATQRRRLS